MIQTLGDSRFAVVVLGYVRLPPAVRYAQQYDAVGFDINPTHIDELVVRRDRALEVSRDKLAAASRSLFTTDLADIAGASIYIVATPPPIERHKNPDLGPGPCAARPASAGVTVKGARAR